MPVGKIVDVPGSYSAYGRVRDEYGSEYTVHASEIAEDAEPGDDFAYQVDIWQNEHGPVTTLRAAAARQGRS